MVILVITVVILSMLGLIAFTGHRLNLRQIARDKQAFELARRFDFVIRGE